MPVVEASGDVPQGGVRGQLVVGCTERSAADQIADRLDQRRHVDDEPMTLQRTEGERQAAQHVPGLQQFQHGLAPVVEQGQRAGVPHQHPQPVEPVSGIARQERQRAGIGLVGLDAALVEQPHVAQRTEQRAPVGASGALFQTLDVADEHRQRAALGGDDVELLQALLVAPEGEPSQELLNGGVARPDGEKNEIALIVADASVGHQVGTFVDAVQRLG